MTLFALRRHLVRATAVALTGVLLPQTSAEATSCTRTTAQTCLFDQPGRYVYVVPEGVHQLRVAVHGAQGGAQEFASLPGGAGGRVDALVAVRPSRRLIVNVGGAGAPGEPGARVYAPLRSGEHGRGGYNGGGEGGRGHMGLPGGGGGGGASDLRLADPLETRILVAGGGGGAGIGAGGAGGAVLGGPGIGPGAGLGGTSAFGGVSGGFAVFTVTVPRPPEPDAPPSTCGVGFSRPSVSMAGPADGGSASGAGAGGGGGGYFGGGTGGQISAEVDSCRSSDSVGVPGGPAGGGSGYADPAWCTDVHEAVGARLGDGLVVITPL